MFEEFFIVQHLIDTDRWKQIVELPNSEETIHKCTLSIHKLLCVNPRHAGSRDSKLK